MKKDCFWYIHKPPAKEEVISALCVRCGKKFEAGFFWEGSKLGYGDYDLKCEMCGDQIHLRELNEQKI